jgi:hypothetical protein
MVASYVVSSALCRISLIPDATTIISALPPEHYQEQLNFCNRTIQLDRGVCPMFFVPSCIISNLIAPTHSNQLEFHEFAQLNAHGHAERRLQRDACRQRTNNTRDKMV